MFRFLFKSQGVYSTSAPLLARTRRLISSFDESDYAEARKWRASFNDDTIPKQYGSVTFARSSGPGGQKVNKTSSKAVLKYPLKFLLQVAPKVIHPKLKMSPRLNKEGDFVFHAQEDRKQSSNERATWQRLGAHVIELIDDSVPGETSETTKKRVENQKKILENMDVSCQFNNSTREEACMLALRRKAQLARTSENMIKKMSQTDRKDLNRQLERRERQRLKLRSRLPRDSAFRTVLL